MPIISSALHDPSKIPLGLGDARPSRRDGAQWISHNRFRLGRYSRGILEILSQANNTPRLSFYILRSSNHSAVHHSSWSMSLSFPTQINWRENAIPRLQYHSLRWHIHRDHHQSTSSAHSGFLFQLLHIQGSSKSNRHSKSVGNLDGRLLESCLVPDGRIHHLIRHRSLARHPPPIDPENID